MKTEFLSKASVYVGTYNKYNNGSIAGKWMNLADYNCKEEFIQACKELHKDEKKPEFMFQDYQYMPEGLISESWISEKVWELMEETTDFDEKECEAISAYMDLFCIDFNDMDAYKLVEDFKEAYCGEYDSEEDYAMEIAPEYFPEIETSDIGLYFDYSAFARSLFTDGYTYYGGVVFRTV